MPTLAYPLSKAAQTRESRLLPAGRKPDVYYEARRRLEAPPGVSKLSPVTAKYMTCRWLWGGFAPSSYEPPPGGISCARAGIRAAQLGYSSKTPSRILAVEYLRRQATRLNSSHRCISYAV